MVAYVFAVLCALACLLSISPAYSANLQYDNSADKGLQYDAQANSNEYNEILRPNQSDFAASNNNSATVYNSNDSPVRVSVSAYGSNKKGEDGFYSTDFIIPIYYTQDRATTVFFNPKYTYTTPFADETNQGFGMRHIFNDSFILGANTFFDRRLSHTKKWYSQTGLGLEYLSYALDLRLNWYKPLSRYKVIGSSYGFGPTSLIQYDSKEEPLQGLDYEAGFPVFDHQTKTRLYLGGFFYHSRLSNDVNGLRVRTETKITSWLNLDTKFDAQSPGRPNFYGGVRLTLPLEWPKSSIKKEFKNSPPANAGNSYLEDRLFDRVVRDIDIQAKTTVTQTKVHDLTYVDNSNASLQNGSFDHPYATIQQGVDNAIGDKWIYVKEGLSQDPANRYAAVTLTNSVVLWGSGYNGGFQGITTSGIYPIIDGAVNGIRLADNNTVMGMQVQNSAQHGIFFTDGVTRTGIIKYNIVNNNALDGISFTTNSGAMSDLVIVGNTCNNNGWNGIDIGSNTGTISGLTLSGNTCNGNTLSGITLYINSGTISNYAITNNTTNNNSHSGIDISHNSGVLTNFYLDQNICNYNTYSGIEMFINSGNISTFTITNNICNNGGIWSSGIDLGINSGVISDLIISGNTANYNTSWSGIDFIDNTGLLSNVAISNNCSLGNKRGVDLQNNSGTISGFTFTQNVVTNNLTDGIILASIGPGTMNTMNFGNGASGGYNSIHDNNHSLGANFDIRNDSGINNLSAQYNWWGQGGGPLAGQIGGANTVDSSNPLSSNPN